MSLINLNRIRNSEQGCMDNELQSLAFSCRLVLYLTFLANPDQAETSFFKQYA